jgi:predicted DNA repair protein MutK
MATGLVALLDDIAAIAKLTAASLDDVTAAAGKASAKAAGVVVDDTAVTPRYVVGLAPARELPMIGRIALGSVRNKLLILLPVALLLSAFAPSAITPLLMVGGTFLAFEGAEKLVEMFAPGHDAEDAGTATTAEALEQQRVSGAIRTDLILSAEIMAIALADVAGEPVLTQAVVLVVVAIVITAGVYGFVGLLVKMDDIGVGIWRRSDTPAIRAAARWLVRGMPLVMEWISAIGIVAMLWVGGGILVHGLEQFGLEPVPHLIHAAADAVTRPFPPALAAIIHWLVTALGSVVVGLVVGIVAAAGVKLAQRLWKGRR